MIISSSPHLSVSTISVFVVFVTRFQVVGEEISFMPTVMTIHVRYTQNEKRKK